MTSLAEQFEQKIDSGQMPELIPLWQIKAKRILIWILFAVFVFTGIASTAVAIWFITDPQAVAVEYQKAPFFDQLVSVLPMFWLGLSLAMGLSALIAFVHAPRGYRHRAGFVAGAIILAFAALGVGVSAVGLSEKIENIAERVPGYRYVQMPMVRKFMQPENGVMIGKVILIDRNILDLRDVHGKIWRVDMSECSATGVKFVKQDDCIRVIGVSNLKDGFIAAQMIAPCPRGVRPLMFELRVKENVLP